MATQIKDPVHGYIELPDPLIERIVDHPAFQRLRYIRQLSATNLVYPGANHTRFEHSLGVYHLGRTVFENLRSEPYFVHDTPDAALDEIQQTLACACLLHDVGHPPFSHISESFLDVDEIRDRLADHGLDAAFHDAGVGDTPLEQSTPHELLSCLIVLREFRGDLEALWVNPMEVCAYILGYSLVYERGGPWQYGLGAQLLRSPIDVDRLDYITRDNQMTGADVLNFDTDRMVDAYTAHPDQGLALSEKALSVLGNYLEGRIALYMWVTQHHKSVYANVLLRELVAELASVTGESPITVDGILEGYIDDNTVMERLRIASRDNPETTLSVLYDRFRSRQFPKTTWKHRIAFADRVDANLDEFSRWLIDNDQQLEKFLASRLDLPEYEVWIERSYVPEYQPAELKDIPIAYGGTTRAAGDWGLYGDRGFDAPIPFVYVPGGYRERAVATLVERFHAENAAER